MTTRPRSVAVRRESFRPGREPSEGLSYESLDTLVLHRHLTMGLKGPSKRERCEAAGGLDAFLTGTEEGSRRRLGNECNEGQWCPGYMVSSSGKWLHRNCDTLGNDFLGIGDKSCDDCYGCAFCPNGKSKAGPYPTQCLPCRQGTFGNGAGYCESCPRGKYQGSFGQTDCFVCPDWQGHKMTSQCNDEDCACEICPEGQVGKDCTECEAGKYYKPTYTHKNMKMLNAQCLACPVGRCSGRGVTGDL